MASIEPRADNGGRWNSVDSARGSRKAFDKKEKLSEAEDDFVEAEEGKKKKKKKSKNKTMEKKEPKNLGAAAAQKQNGESAEKEDGAETKVSVAEIGNQIAGDRINMIQKSWEEGNLSEDVEAYLLKEDDFVKPDDYDQKELRDFIDDKNRKIKSIHKVYLENEKIVEKGDEKEKKEKQPSTLETISRGVIRSKAKDALEGETLRGFIGKKVEEGRIAREELRKAEEEKASQQTEEVEISEAERAEQLSKFAGHSGSLSAGEAGASPEIGITGVKKMETEKSSVADEESKEQAAREGNADKSEEAESEKGKQKNDYEKMTGFEKALSRSVDNASKTFALFESGELEASRFKSLDKYFDSIDAHYKKESESAEKLSESNRNFHKKKIAEQYEGAKAEITKHWEETRNVLVERVKKYVDEEVERKLQMIETDKAKGMVSDDIKMYTLIIERIDHAIPKDKDARKEIVNYMKVGRSKIREAYKSAFEAIGEKNKDVEKKEKIREKLAEVAAKTWESMAQDIKASGIMDKYAENEERGNEWLKSHLRGEIGMYLENKLVSPFGFDRKAAAVTADEIVKKIENTK